MYYATYKGIGSSDITCFESEQDRDNWVEFKDEFSLSYEVTKENAVFERKVFKDKKEISKIVNNKAIKKIADEFNPNQWWYLRSEV